MIELHHPNIHGEIIDNVLTKGAQAVTLTAFTFFHFRSKEIWLLMAISMGLPFRKIN